MKKFRIWYSTCRPTKSGGAFYIFTPDNMPDYHIRVEVTESEHKAILASAEGLTTPESVVEHELAIARKNGDTIESVGFALLREKATNTTEFVGIIAYRPPVKRKDMSFLLPSEAVALGMRVHCPFFISPAFYGHIIKQGCHATMQ
jgi:hypothetical protein